MSRGKSRTSGMSANGSIRLGGRRTACSVPGGRACAARVRWLVAADAAGRLARLHRGETLHPLDRQVVLVQGDEEQRPQGRHLEVGRAVGLDRHGAQDALQGERAADAQRLLAAGEIGRLGQLFQHEQLLDLAAADACHVAAGVDVGQQQAARACVRLKRDRGGPVRAGGDAAAAVRGGGRPQSLDLGVKTVSTWPSAVSKCRP